MCNTELTGGEAKRQGELPQELPETEPGYVGTGTGQATREKPRGGKKERAKTSKGLNFKQISSLLLIHEPLHSL